MAKTVKVMRFNIRVAIGVDVANEFCYRAPIIKKMIDKESPGKKGNFYKANLHTNSVLSDGKFTHEEILNYYQTRKMS